MRLIGFGREWMRGVNSPAACRGGGFVRRLLVKPTLFWQVCPRHRYTVKCLYTIPLTFDLGNMFSSCLDDTYSFTWQMTWLPQPHTIFFFQGTESIIAQKARIVKSFYSVSFQAAIHPTAYAYTPLTHDVHLEAGVFLPHFDKIL